MTYSVQKVHENKQFGKISSTYPVHEITDGHWSLSGTIPCVTDRIRFLLVTVTDRFSNLNSISYTEDRHKLRVTGTKCRLPDTGEIFISGADTCIVSAFLRILQPFPLFCFYKDLTQYLKFASNQETEKSEKLQTLIYLDNTQSSQLNCIKMNFESMG